jgi:hypothetical protein
MVARMGAEIKSPPESGPYCFRIRGRIYQLLSQLYPHEASIPGYGQLHTVDSAAATIKRLENQSNQGCMAVVMHRVDEVLRQVNTLAESCKQTRQMKWNIWINK